MKTVSLIVMPLLLVGAARASAAQDPPGIRLTSLAAAATLSAADAAPAGVAPSQGVQPRPVQAPPPPPPPVRSGSMIGYIDDATVGTKVRIRFDTGMNIDRPDRAEFFYAKCGCYSDPCLVGNPAFRSRRTRAAPGCRDRSELPAVLCPGGVRAEPARVHFRRTAIALAPASGVRGRRRRILQLVGTRRPQDRREVRAFIDQHAGRVRAGAVLPAVGRLGKGLGTNHASLEPALLIYQRASERVVIEGELSVRLPFGRIGARADCRGRQVRRQCALLWHRAERRGLSFRWVQRLARHRVHGLDVLSGFVTLPGPTDVSADASGTNIVNLKFGGRIGWKDYSSFYVGYGKALTDAKWYDDILRFEYRLLF